MQTPTTYQIRTAIEVLEKLGERIDKHAARSLLQIPPCREAGEVAGQVAVNAREQNSQVKAVTGLLQTWHNELDRHRKLSVSHHV